MNFIHAVYKNGTWIADCTNTAAIWIPNNKNLCIKERGTGNGFVWIKVNNFIIVSCYLTPNDIIENFNRKLNDIEDTFRDNNNLVIGGDFNSKAVEWGSNLTNPRGTQIVYMAARMGLSVANVENTQHLEDKDVRAPYQISHSFRIELPTPYKTG